MILLLLLLDVLNGVVMKLSPLSDDFCGLSERGDLIEFLRGCLTTEALIDRGMHFDFLRIDSSFCVESNGLQVLAVQVCILTE